MYFMLGSVMFEPVDLTDFNEIHSADFAEHAVIKGKPKLQAMSEKLTELSFSIRLHHKIGGVESRYQTLLDAKANQQALMLILGAGKNQGNFVITDISSNTLFTDAFGNVLCREMSISLREFVGNPQQSLLGAALNLTGQSLIGSMLPSNLATAVTGAKAAVSQGLNIYNQSKRLIDEVVNTVSIVRNLSRDPMSALGYLPSILSGVEGALDGFGQLTGMQSAFENVRQYLGAVSQFANGTTKIYRNLQAIKENTSKASQTGWENWFTPVDVALSDMTETMTNLNKPIEQMTAFVISRTDEEGENEPNLS